MKKGMSLVLVLVLCLSLCGFGKSQAVQETEKAINDIGTVSLSSEDAIKKAEKLMSVLTEREKEKVSNRLILIDARETFDELVAEIIFEKAEDAYAKLTTAAKLAITGVEDVYAGAYAGIQGKYSKYNTMMYYMKFTTSLNNSDLFDAYTALHKFGEVEDSAANGVAVVLMAHNTCGTFDELDDTMSEGLSIIKELSNNYCDDVYAPKLQEYYTAIIVCADFFMNPTGTFDELDSTIKYYKDDITAIQTSLGLLFN